MRLSNDGVWDTESWEAYLPYKLWTLTPGNGTKTVFVQFKNGAGLDSIAFSDSIGLVTEVPNEVQALSFNVTYGETNYAVETYSNSTVSDLSFNQTLRRLHFSVNGTSGTAGFCNITVPAELMSGDFTIYMDDVPLVEGVDYTEAYNGTHYLFSITYTHSSHVIALVSTNVIPDFTGWLFLPFLMFVTLLALTFRNKLKKQRKPIHSHEA